MGLSASPVYAALHALSAGYEVPVTTCLAQPTFDPWHHPWPPESIVRHPQCCSSGYLSLAKLPSPRALMPPPQKWLLPPRPTRTHHITPPDLGYMKTLKLQTLPACLHKAPLCLLPLPVLQTLPFSLQLLPVSHWAFPVTLSLVPVKNLMLPLPFCLLLPVNKLPLPVSLSLLPITCPMLPFTLRRPPINSPLLPVRPCPQGVACQNRPALICRLVLAQTLLSLMIKACIQAP